VDKKAVEDALKSFVEVNRLRLVSYGSRESQTLEPGAMLLAVTHYERQGYSIKSHNAPNGEFAVNLSSRGRPWNFSWWSVSRDNEEFFIYTN